MYKPNINKPSKKINFYTPPHLKQKMLSIAIKTNIKKIHQM